MLSQSSTVDDDLADAFFPRILDLVAACRWRLEDACGEGWTLMAGNVHDAIRMSGLKRKEAPDFELSRSRPATFLTSYCLLHQHSSLSLVFSAFAMFTISYARCTLLRHPSFRATSTRLSQKCPFPPKLSRLPHNQKITINTPVMGRRWHLNEEEGGFMLSHAHRPLWNTKKISTKIFKNIPKLHHLHPNPSHNPN